jgi:hypothetical protein
VKHFANRLIRAGRMFGPYLAIELVMPGGSLLAVLLLLYRTSARTRRDGKVRNDEFLQLQRLHT